MVQRCNPCGGTGFVNAEQLDELIPGWEKLDASALLDRVRNLAELHEVEHDVRPCDCCGSSDSDSDYPWYAVPGEHYNEDDPQGPHGPYVYNGGLCECH